MTYRIIIEPTAEHEIRSAVRWKTENVSPTAAARWYNGLVQKIDTLAAIRPVAHWLRRTTSSTRKSASCYTAEAASGCIVIALYLLSSKIRSTFSMSVTPPVTSWSRNRDARSNRAVFVR